MSEACEDVPAIRKQRIILLSGAPRRQDLTWTEDELRPILPAQSTKKRKLDDAGDGKKSPAWRSLSLEHKNVESGLSQPHFPVYAVINPADWADVRDHAKNPQEPYADPPDVHLQASRDTVTHSASTMTISFLSTDSSLSMEHSAAFEAQSISNRHELPFEAVKVVDLADLPKATEIVAASRHSKMLENLIVVILSVQPRERKQIGHSATRRSVDLVKLIVADHSCSSFELAIWLDPIDGPMPSTDCGRNASSEIAQLPDILKALRRSDIILVQNLVLGEFQGKVNASSIRQGTALTLLYRLSTVPALVVRPRYRRRHIQSYCVEDDAHDPVLAKVCRLIEWSDAFLEASDVGCGSSNDQRLEHPDQLSRASKHSVKLPADTQ